MTTRRGTLYLGSLIFFVLASGCQGDEFDASENAAMTGGECRDGCDDSVLEKDFDDTTAPLSSGTSCSAGSDDFEPNDKRSSAVEAPLGKTQKLSLCSGDEDWFRLVVPEGKIVRAGIEMDVSAGDLDLVVYDQSGNIVGSRYGQQYPSSWRGFETNTEFYGFYSERGSAVYYLRVVGNAGAQNAYSLQVDHFPYVDGQSCTGAGFSFADCAGTGANGSGLLPFPFPDPDDGPAYEFESLANYRFARRELIMLVRYALSRTEKAFPHTTPLSLIDICQKDGITPGYDMGSPRHPASTHDQGGNIDIAYFQTDGSNDGVIVCGDGAKHADGYCTDAAATKNFVDFPRQAYFMAQLFGSSRTRVVGVDKVLAPLITNAAKTLAALPDGHPQKINATELAGFTNKMAFGSGWPYHHHHIHLSMHWWSKEQNAWMTPDQSTDDLSIAMPTVEADPWVSSESMK